jgi:hypothetical protein
MFNFLKRVFGRFSKSDAGKTVIAAAAVVAKERVERRIDETDSLREDEKVLVKDGIKALLIEILADDNDEETK